MSSPINLNEGLENPLPLSSLDPLLKNQALENILQNGEKLLKEEAKNRLLRLLPSTSGESSANVIAAYYDSLSSILDTLVDEYSPLNKKEKELFKQKKKSLENILNNHVSRLSNNVKKAVEIIDGGYNILTDVFVKGYTTLDTINDIGKFALNESKDSPYSDPIKALAKLNELYSNAVKLREKVSSKEYYGKILPKIKEGVGVMLIEDMPEFNETIDYMKELYKIINSLYSNKESRDTFIGSSIYAIVSDTIANLKGAYETMKGYIKLAMEPNLLNQLNQ